MQQSMFDAMLFLPLRAALMLIAGGLGAAGN
jgi:hypothetical protein